jgi:hypothetical protein
MPIIEESQIERRTRKCWKTAVYGGDTGVPVITIGPQLWLE